jgi:DNA-binding LytR/AlgR family response regulator
MTKLKCCVIDDEPLAGNLIGNYAERTPLLELVGIYTSAQEAFPLISSGDIDLIFLDIQMPQLSGMEFAKLLPPKTMVIFVTAYQDYAIQGIKVNAVDYLLKPVSYEEFLESVNLAVHRHDTLLSLASSQNKPNETAAENIFAEDSDSLIVKTEYRLRQISKSDILYIEGLKDYVRIFVEGEPRSIMTLLSMKALEKNLPANQFLRVHRSFIVNLQKIHTIERNKIIMTDRSADGVVTHEIPVGDSYRQFLSAYVASRSLTLE